MAFKRPVFNSNLIINLAEPLSVLSSVCHHLDTKAEWNGDRH